MSTTDDVILDYGDKTLYTKDDEKHAKHISRAWGCILTPDFFQKSQRSSIDNGEGINVYRFLRPDQSTEKGNCTYYYADKGCTLWNSILGGMNNRSAFEKEYRHTHSYVICVSVPAAESGDDTIQSVRLFQHDTNKEIQF